MTDDELQLVSAAKAQAKLRSHADEAWVGAYSRMVETKTSATSGSIVAATPTPA